MARNLVLLVALAAAMGLARAGEAGKLDFWLGDWDVFGPDQARLGRNRIESLLNGHAILENWTDADGSEGKSWFYYVPALRLWRQVWVTSDGHVKEKLESSGAPPGAVRFAGEITASDGLRRWLDRTTLTPQPDGSVVQVIEISLDRGEHWETRFVGIYRPHVPPP